MAFASLDLTDARVRRRPRVAAVAADESVGLVPGVAGLEGVEAIMRDV